MFTEIRKLQPKYFLSSSCMLLLSEMKCFIQFPTIFAIAVYLVFLFVCFFVFAVVFVFVFFYHYFTLFYFIIFLYFTTHIFVTLIKVYKIYLVAKRPRQACLSFPNKEISHFPCFFFNRYFVSMNMSCKLFIGLHTRYLQCLSKNKIPDCFHKLLHSYCIYQGIEYRAEIIWHGK